MKKNISLRLIALCLVCVSSALHAGTHVLLTVDVESFSAGNPRENIWGELPGYEGRFGVPKIIEILDRNNTTGTFYLNVYEIEKHGDTELKKLAKYVVSSGHDLQLHTHPGTMYGQSGLSDYPLEKQKEILLEGKQLIYKWTGQQVIAHRAGAYKGNRDTISALKQIGIVLDSSLSPASASPLYNEGFSGNDVFEIDGVIEVPITYYTQVKVGDFESKRFLDIESTSLAELKKTLSDFAANGSCVANIMMHSFSITRYGYPDERVMKKLDALLKFIHDHPDLEASSTSDFIGAYKEAGLSCNPSPDFVPNTGILLTYLRSWEHFGEGWKNVVVALSLPGMLALVLLVVVVIRIRKNRGAG